MPLPGPSFAPSPEPLYPRSKTSELPHWLDSAGAWAAFCVPFGVTLLRAATSPQWRDDRAVIRALALAPTNGEGSVAAVITQLFAFLPIGGRLLRASMVSALGLAVSGFFIYTLSRRLLAANSDTPRLTPLLALGATLSATLSPAWQIEGTIAGGTTVGVALALAALFARVRVPRDDLRTWFVLGAITALTAVESRAAGIALAAALLGHVMLSAELPERRGLALFVLGAVVPLVICGIPLLVHLIAGSAFSALSERPVLDFAFELSSSSARQKVAPGAFEAWLSDPGLTLLSLGSAGALWGIARPRLRPLSVALIAPCLADLVLAPEQVAVLGDQPWSALRLLAIGSRCALSALGFQTAAAALERAEIPFARLAARALVVFQFTLVLMSSEDASFLADRRSQHAAEVWTDEALHSLPPKSAVLVRSNALALRLLAAQIVRGERPDLLIVPIELLGQGRTRIGLLEREPALGALIRDVSISGRPSEFALSSLADVRPLHVEFDPGWDPRLFEHAVPRSLWLGFAPHALGRSDRAAGAERAHRGFARVAAFARQPEYSDEATLTALADAIAEQARALAILGDRDAARVLLDDLESAAPQHALIAPIRRRLGGSGPSDQKVADLLR